MELEEAAPDLGCRTCQHVYGYQRGVICNHRLKRRARALVRTVESIPRHRWTAEEVAAK